MCELLSNFVMYRKQSKLILPISNKVYRGNTYSKTNSNSAVILIYQNENLQVTCDCYLPLEDHQLFLIIFKAGCNCINHGISGKLT